MNVTGHKVVDSSPVEGVNCSPDLAYFSPLLLRHFLAANIPSPHSVQLGAASPDEFLLRNPGQGSGCS